LIILTRWHEDDLAGRLLEHQRTGGEYADQWEVVNLPAISEAIPTTEDPRQPDEALWPSKFSLKALMAIKENIGVYDWEALYQQRPQPPGGSKIQRDWFNIIDKPPEGLYWSRFWDLAVSVKTSADYTASIAGAIDSFGNIYLRDMIRGRWEWPDTRRLLINTAKHEKIPLGIEEAGVQAGFIQELLRDKKLQGTSIKGYRPEKDKLTRALAWISRAESGKLFLIKGPWINEFLNECQLFTGHGDKHDDQIDAVSGVYNMLNRVTTGSLYIPDPTEDNGLIFAGIMNEVF
jgi:predicted phage terminase large subunit-like protein